MCRQPAGQGGQAGGTARTRLRLPSVPSFPLPPTAAMPSWAQAFPLLPLSSSPADSAQAFLRLGALWVPAHPEVPTAPRPVWGCRTGAQHDQRTPRPAMGPPVLRGCLSSLRDGGTTWSLSLCPGTVSPSHSAPGCSGFPVPPARAGSCPCSAANIVLGLQQLFLLVSLPRVFIDRDGLWLHLANGVPPGLPGVPPVLS